MVEKVLLCGPFPSPVGGVSIHIDRLSYFLIKKGYSVLRCDESPKKKAGIYNIRSFDIFSYVKLIRSSNIIHIHSAIHILRFLHIFIGYIFGKKTVVTIHSWRAGSIASAIWRLVFKVAPVELIFVSQEIRDAFKLPGLVSPAYINPEISLEKQLPQDLTSWIERNKTDNKYLAVSNAYRLVENNQQDLYGLDLCIDVVKKIDSLVFVFVIANPECAQKKIAQYRKEITSAGISNRFLIYEDSVSFVKLLSIADISVRATNTDGDALSVRESLFLNCKTVASDVSFRPDGVIKFSNRNARDLEEKIKLLIIDDNKKFTSIEAPKDCTADIIDIYTCIIDKRKS